MWKEGGGSRTGQRKDLTCAAIPAKPQLTGWELGASSAHPSVLQETEMAGPLNLHLSPSLDVGHPGKGVTSGEEAASAEASSERS